MRPTTLPCPSDIVRACLLAVLAACQSARSPDPRVHDTLVEASSLAAELAQGGADLVVLDVRPRPEYEAQHLAGALWLPLDEWEALSLAHDTGLDHAAAWHARLGALGIDGDDTVLVYNGGRMTHAARAWFILQHFGVARAAVIDGGFPLLAEEAARGGLHLDDRPATRPAARFEPRGAGVVGLVDRQAMKAAVDRGDVQVLDVRTEAEFTGQDLRQNARGGHLPGAINLPHVQLLDERGRLRSVEELDRILRAAGFQRGRAVITHCDGGGRAALAALAAARAGYGPVLSYYLSFGDWSKDASCPVVHD